MMPYRLAECVGCMREGTLRHRGICLIILLRRAYGPIGGYDTHLVRHVQQSSGFVGRADPIIPTGLKLSPNFLLCTPV